VLPFFVRLQPCLVGIEACGGAHCWAAKLTTLGHHVKMMAPQFVKPCVKSNKSDASTLRQSARVARLNMRFVPMKSPEQQAVLPSRTARQGFAKARNAQAGQIRGLMMESASTFPGARGTSSSACQT
jgi:transposase